MIRSNQDFFNELEKLISQFKQFGLDDFAQQLERAMYISTVPGEIFGEIELTLKCIKAHRKQLPKLSDQKVEKLLKILKKVN